MYDDCNVVRGHFKKHEIPKTASLPKLDDIADLAKIHGFDKEDCENLTFEPWLISGENSTCDLSGNLALINFDSDVLYFSKVKAALVPHASIFIFSIEPNFAYGEPWSYYLTVHYICHADDSSNPVFSVEYEPSKSLVIAISQGCDGYEMTLAGGLRVEYLISEIATPLDTLAKLFAMKADELTNSSNPE
jgi:hypothetical protein